MKFNYYLFIIGSFLWCLTSCNNDPEQKVTTEEAAIPTDTSELGKKIAELTTLVEANPDKASLLHQRAELYVEKKDMANALLDMQKVIALDTTVADYFVTLSDCHLAANQPGKAKAALEKCLSLDPKNKEGNMKLAELFFLARQYPNSIQHLNNVLKEDIHNPKAYFMKGMTFKEMGDTLKAISSFQTAIEQNPEYYDAFMQLAVVCAVKNNPLALQYFNGAVKLNARSEEALYGRAMWFQENMQDYDKAIQDYTSILQLNPDNKFAHFNLGYVHYQYLKVYSEAIKHYSNAINADPDYTEAVYNRGLAFETSGNIMAAKKDYERAIQLRPNYVLAQKGLQRVKQ